MRDRDFLNSPRAHNFQASRAGHSSNRGVHHDFGAPSNLDNVTHGQFYDYDNVGFDTHYYEYAEPSNARTLQEYQEPVKENLSEYDKAMARIRGGYDSEEKPLAPPPRNEKSYPPGFGPPPGYDKEPINANKERMPDYYGNCNEAAWNKSFYDTQGPNGTLRKDYPSKSNYQSRPCKNDEWGNYSEQSPSPLTSNYQPTKNSSKDHNSYQQLSDQVRITRFIKTNNFS